MSETEGQVKNTEMTAVTMGCLCHHKPHQFNMPQAKEIEDRGYRRGQYDECMWWKDIGGKNTEAAYERGFKEARERAAKVLEPMAAHNESAYTGDKVLARGYRHAISVIESLTPEKEA